MTESGAEHEAGPGGYDASYRQCPCFWGTEPGRLVRLLSHSADLAGAHVLDLGCGEGKNAAFLARIGCVVEAWEISSAALNNARATWPYATVRWRKKDALSILDETRRFDVVICYGLYHCLPLDKVASIIAKVQHITTSEGYNITACFNDRKQVDIASAHPAFNPTCLPHEFYLDRYAGWRLLAASDEDLTERHPTNMIRHTHSMTRILAQK